MLPTGESSRYSCSHYSRGDLEYTFTWWWVTFNTWWWGDLEYTFMRWWATLNTPLRGGGVTLNTALCDGWVTLNTPLRGCGVTLNTALCDGGVTLNTPLRGDGVVWFVDGVTVDWFVRGKSGDWGCVDGKFAHVHVRSCGGVY